MNLNIDTNGLCKAYAAHNAVPGIMGGSLAQKNAAATEAPRLDTKAIMAKLDVMLKHLILMSPKLQPSKLKTKLLALYFSGYAKESRSKQSHPKFNSQE